MVQVGAVAIRLVRNSTNSNWDRSSASPSRNSKWRSLADPAWPIRQQTEASTLQQRLQTEAQLQSFIPPRSSVKQASDVSISVNDVKKSRGKSDACR